MPFSDYDNDNTPIRTEYIGAVSMSILSGPLRGKVYACPSISYLMQIGSVPVLQATIGIGKQINEDNSDISLSSDILKLVKLLYSADFSGDNSSLVACAFYEERPDPKDNWPHAEAGTSSEQVCIFKGYIINCSYKCEDGQQVQIVCGWPACKLSQLMDFRNSSATANELISRIKETANMGTEAAAKGRGFSANDGFYEAAASALNQDSSILQRLAMCSTIAKRFRSFEDRSFDNIPPDPVILEAFGGETYLNPTVIKEKTDLLFNEMILRALLSGGSSMQNVLGLLSSSDLMLSVIPRWSCDDTDDFKLDICPDAHSMSDNADIELEPKHILGVSGSVEGVEQTPIPDVLFLSAPQVGNFSRSAAEASAASGELADIFGVASRIPELETRLQEAVRAGDNPMPMTSGKEYTMIVTNAPEWLAASPLAYIQTGGIHRSKTRKEKNKKEESIDDTYDSDRYMYTDAINAMAMHTYRKTYLATSMIRVKLSPGLRFGKSSDIPMLENNLGANVRVRALGYNDESLVLYGRLRGIQYGVSRASSSMVSYVIDLDNVRIAGMPGLRDIPSPIYIDKRQ